MQQAVKKYQPFMYSHLDPFRGAHQNNQYIYGNYAYLTGQSAPSSRKFRYVNTGGPLPPEEVARMIREKQCDTLVLNDGGVDHKRWVSHPDIIAAFESLFPEKSKYEL